MTFRGDNTMTTTVTNSQYDLGHTVSEVINDDTLKVKESWKWDEKRCVSFQCGSPDWTRTIRFRRASSASITLYSLLHCLSIRQAYQWLINRSKGFCISYQL